MGEEDEWLGQFVLGAFDEDGNDNDESGVREGIDAGNSNSCVRAALASLENADEADLRKRSRAEKLRLSEESFQEQKKSWQPSCQDSLACSRLRDGALKPTEASVTALKTLAELQYYLRDYKRALHNAKQALEGHDLNGSDEKELSALVDRCKQRLLLAGTISSLATV